MRVALVGLPLSGKTTLFEAVGGQAGKPGGAGGGTVAVVPVPDPRIDRLTEIYQPKKVTYATIEFIDLPGLARDASGGGDQRARIIGCLRDAETLIALAPMFDLGTGKPDLDEANRGLADLQTELILNDLEIIERRRAKLTLQIQRKLGDVDAARREEAVIIRLHEAIENETLDAFAMSADEDKQLRPYQFLCLKATLQAYNMDESDFADPAFRERIEADRNDAIAICAPLEAEIAQLSPEEQAEFLADIGLDEPTRARMVQACYRRLNLISFLTVGPDEVRAWTLPNGATAVQAADQIHSDIARGFIRAEVIPYAQVIEQGDFKKAKAAGKMRLEGKEYIMQNGDVVNFRFSV